jgi:hypothetical protein
MKLTSMGSFFLALFLSQIALAGGWSSGGGGLLKDAVNPWFLNNTKKVNYCISIDQKNFGASQDIVRLQLNRAMTFWKKQFEHAILANLTKFGQLQIASQVFTETGCDDHTDIVFQFGILNHQQKKFLKDPTEYAAITVRTSYDEINLRAKGFVYVSPSYGPLAYNSNGVVKNAWKFNSGHLLYLTLLHELGHVFGLQHMGSFGALMSEGFVEAILIDPASSATLMTQEINFFTLVKASRLFCAPETDLDIWQKYFGAQVSDKCFQFVFNHDPKNEFFGKTIMTVLVAKTSFDEFHEIHKIELAMDRFYPTFTNLIWLPQHQTVFDKDDLQASLNSRILGISGLAIGKQGHFTLSDGTTKRSVSLKFEQGSGQYFIDGVIDGKIIHLF